MTDTLAPAVPSRPYANSRKEPSVTTILELLPKPGLPWGAARETAMFALLHPEKYSHLELADAVDVLRRHHKGVWDGRAAMGTLAHAVLEAYVHGETVDIVHLVQQTIDSDSKARTWKDRDRDDVIEDALGYVLGIEAWWDDWQPTDARSEVVVRWPGLYIGTTDLRATCHGEDWVWDVKGTAKQDDGTGIYADSWTLQLAMYGMARETVSYEMREDPKLKSGWRAVESGTGPWSRPQRYGVIHLRGDERYTPYEMNVTRDVERAALRLARAYPGWKAIPEMPKLAQPRSA